MRILVTGGCGYLGTHTIVDLLAANHEVVAVDNLSNSSPEALKRVEKISSKRVPLYTIDCADKVAMAKVFKNHDFDAVIHFAGLKAVGESVKQPVRYYMNNLNSTLVLCETMQEAGVKRLIFSSSATVYGVPQEHPLREDSPVGPITNPYGRTKVMIEEILKDVVTADPEWRITLLRYFNPIGAHESGLIGEDPTGVPNNVFPYIAQVASGKQPKLPVYGNDYPTLDGTGVRDYIHVSDLAKGHLAALEHTPSQPVVIYNLGTGYGTSVFELIKTFEKISGQKINYEVLPRRSGDVATCFADAVKANEELGWNAVRSIEDACIDAWRWQSRNPRGYTEET